jgi:hypothetical protein
LEAALDGAEFFTAEHAALLATMLARIDQLTAQIDRYDHLWTCIGRHLPWVATQQISTHWLRHTTLTWVERNFGYATTLSTPNQPTLRGKGDAGKRQWTLSANGSHGAPLISWRLR